MWFGQSSSWTWSSEMTLPVTVWPASTIALRQRARELGMRTLREDGVRKVLAGMTTAEEVISTTMSDLD